MKGKGNERLVNAMAQVLIQENAQKNLLQAGTGDISIVVTFDSQKQRFSSPLSVIRL